MDNKQKKLALLGILLAGCLLTSIASEWTQAKGGLSAPVLSPSYTSGNKAQRAAIKVYVSGAVLEPGMYDLPPGSRAWEAIEAAGGLREDANADRVNLAKKLKDGSQVNVPALKAAIGKSSAGANAARSAENSAAAGRVNLNQATAEELSRLPGIGPATAGRIVEQRRRKRFTKAEDLLQIKGIGRAKLERLRNLVEVN